MTMTIKDSIYPETQNSFLLRQDLELVMFESTAVHRDLYFTVFIYIKKETTPQTNLTALAL